MLRVVYSPEAEAELLEAVPFYSTKKIDGEAAFFSMVNAHVLEIAASPQRFPLVGRNIRRCVVRKYPFIIFFREYPDHVRIVAFAHTSRHPRYWRRRA